MQLNNEKNKLRSIGTCDIIDYIKTSIEILLNLKGDSENETNLIKKQQSSHKNKYLD